MQKIWLIGGTGDSAIIAEAIAAHQLPCIVTVTTETAQNLYPNSPYLTLQVGSLHSTQIQTFCQQQEIIAIVDASHPYAVQISQQAIAIAQTDNIPYLRYERPSLSPTSGIIILASFDRLIEGNYLENQRVFLTIGYQALPLFEPWQTRSILFARILPRKDALEVALTSGFSSDRLVAIRPPISVELERELWKHWNISLVVTKASGKQGGEERKRLVAQELGVSLIIIDRPTVSYPQQTDQVSAIIEFCQQSFDPKRE